MLEAVQSALRQTHVDCEVLVIDDASGDETVSLLERIDDPRLQLVQHHRCNNPSTLRNAGVARARGRYVAFLDSDDRWRPTKIQQQLDALALQGNCRWSYTRFDHIDVGGRPIAEPAGGPWPVRHGWILEPLLRTDVLAIVPTVLAETKLVTELGGFDEEFRFGEDYDFVLRLAGASPACVVGEKLVSVRQHPERSTLGRPGFWGWPEVYRKHEGRIPDSRLKALCRGRRSAVLSRHASYYSHRRQYRAAVRLLARGLPRGAGQRQWWLVALKTAIRPFLSQRVLEALRRKREARGSRN